MHGLWSKRRLRDPQAVDVRRPRRNAGPPYPTRCWSERDDSAAFGWGIEGAEGEALARALAGPLRAATTYVSGAPDETCDYVYVLCLGRPPSLVDLREGRLTEAEAEDAQAALASGPVEELYLRVALSSLARVGAGAGGEGPRRGVG